jgi:hypothetical protein
MSLKKRLHSETTSSDIVVPDPNLTIIAFNDDDDAMMADLAVQGIDAAHSVAHAARTLLAQIELSAHTDESTNSTSISNTTSNNNSISMVEIANAARAVVRHDAQLAKVVRQSAAREARVARVTHLRAQLLRRESAMASLCGALREAEAKLVAALADAQAALPPNLSVPVDVDALIAYSQKISYTTAPPPGWNPELPLGRRRPPFPQDDQMRGSVLFSPLVKAIDARLKAASAAEVVAVRVPELDEAALAAARSLPALSSSAKPSSHSTITAGVAATAASSARFVPTAVAPTAPPPIVPQVAAAIDFDNDAGVSVASSGGREELTGLAAKTADDEEVEWE